jgi:uncharacterized repeat protein (TIGR03837 family)
MPAVPLALATPRLARAASWDIFCRVIDNHGDLGVCWRLAADLAARGHAVRLWVDDLRALAWMAPDALVQPTGINGPAPQAGCVDVIHWSDDAPRLDPGEVVIEAFGCDPPEAFLARMAARARPPVWINLEYLSAESYVERSHGLRSPQSTGPAAGLDKWFFYPGFTARTGGLLREPGLVPRLEALDAPAFLAELGIEARPGERRVSVFCYPNPALAELPDRLANAPTLLLAAPGAATEALSRQSLPSNARVQALPWLAQADYDRLLRACDLNFVRGEDSFVRAQWAARPFVWHVYPQHDGVHASKLDAFLDRHLATAGLALSSAVRAWMRAWNGLDDALPATLPPSKPWQAATNVWRDELLAQPDLVTQLSQFVDERR